MENASKALIIAGAILLSILLISLGIMIYNQASGVVNSNAMSETEISTFNSKFTQYEGSKVRGSQVNSLLQAVATNNLTYTDDTSKQIKIKDGSGEATVITSAPAKKPTANLYKVEFSYKNGGLVDIITISDAS